MYKVSKSYSKKSERKHERSGGGASDYYRVHAGEANAPYVTSAASSVRNGRSGFHQDASFEGGGGYHRNGQLIPADQHRYYDTAWSQSHQGQQQQQLGFSESSSYETHEHYERKMQRAKKTRGERSRSRKANGHHESNGSLSSRRLTDGEHLSSRDALLQWARRVTKPYPNVNVTNFTSSWRDGLAFNAILHRYRPNLIDWNKISDKNVSARERLRNAFDAAHREFGIAKLLDPEDVDVDNPDEKSIITYVSELYNALPHEELNRGLDDIISRLTRGIGITNEKLDLILKRIEEAEKHDDQASALEIVEDLNALEVPITELFEDVETLRQHQHPETNEFDRQVLGLHQRRTAYLDRLGARADTMHRQTSERLESVRQSTFSRLEEAIRWVRERLDKLNEMQFTEQLEVLEDMFEQHKVDNRDIQDFRQTVNQCIARQADVSAEDSHEYCELLRTLESEYQQLRDLSAGRMLDLDSLIAFIRAAQLELVWINEREDIEVSRNWSDVNQLDLPMLQNYYRQLLHEIEIHEPQFNEVHNQGAALLNQRHPAVDVIEVYLRSLQTQWDWLLSLSHCLEGHLRDALNVKSFKEDAEQVEQWMKRQSEELENNYNRTDFTLEEGERFLRELDEIREVIHKYHSLLLQLTERSSQISPLWQRGVRITRPIPVTALADYQSKDIHIRKGDECTLVDNSDLIHWRVRGVDGTEATVPSVVFRIPPPDPQLTSLLSRLHAEFEKLKKLWDKKHRLIRYNMVLNTMRQVREWDLDTFLAIPPEERDEIIKAINDDAHKLLSELDPNDPLALRLKEELRLTNEHFYDLLNRAQKGPEPDHSSQFDEKLAELLKKLDEAWKKLNERVGEGVPRTLEELENIIRAHKEFEDALQSLDVDVSTVKELYRQIPNPTPNQRANYDHLNGRWEDLWDLSRMYVERLKALETVLQGIAEVTDIVRRHEITLSSFDDMPAALEKLRGVHAQLLELNMVLQQQQNIVDSLNRNMAQLRQHVQRTRYNVASHPDVDRLEEQVQVITDRWDNVCSQVAERLRVAEEAQQTQMVYRSQYEEEIQWLDRVEATINSLRRPEELRPEELQSQLDQLTAEYAQLKEHTATIESINNEGGKFIREAKQYDLRLNQYGDNVVNIHGPGIRSEFRRQHPQPKNGAQIVTEELEALNRRFAQLSSVILERKNIVNVLIQNWKRKQQEEEDRRRAEDEAKRRAFEAARLKALEDADRLRREREAAEAARRAADEADRLRRERDAAEAARRAAEEAERRRREDEERRRRQREEEEERRRREEEERRRREDEERRRREAEAKVKEPIMPNINLVGSEMVQEYETADDLWDRAKIAEHEDEPMMFQEDVEVKTQFYEMEGVHHKQTGEILTFVEAIRQGLLNLSSGGDFIEIAGTRISLEEAAKRGLISEDINEVLNGRHGIRHPDTKEEITLSEAIRINLYDPDTRQLRDIHTGEVLDMYDCVSRGICDLQNQYRLIKMKILKLPPIALEHALKSNVLNPETGEFKGKYTDPMPLRDALESGYIQLTRQDASGIAIAITLSDALENGFIDGHSGEFVDRNSDDKFSLRDALSRDNPLLNTSVREVVNTEENQRIMLSDAITRRAVDHRQGKFVDLKSQTTLSLHQAYDKGFIGKPITLTEASERNLVDLTNRFIEPGTQHRRTLLEAIAAGIIDPEVRHIADPNENDIISVADALERGVLSPEGRIILEWSSDGAPQRSVDLHDARHQGYLTKRVRHTIFDVKGIKNTSTGENLSYKDAIAAGVLNEQSRQIVDTQTNNRHSVRDARRDLIDPLLQQLLTSPVGLVEDTHATLIDAVSNGLIDAERGVLFDKRSQRELSPRQAYEHGLLTLRGAMRLAALFDVHPSLMTPLRKRDHKKKIRRPGQSSAHIGEDQIKVTLAEAMKQGLIDSNTQRFRQGNQEMSLEDALSQGLIDLSSEWIVPAKASGVGPTIEEKTQETVTETGQQLAPKIYPDKAVEETVNTVKRIRRTETSAVGGPGGVSVYRAITGGKAGKEVDKFASTAGPVMTFRPVGQAVIEEHEQSWSFDASSGSLVDLSTGERLSLDHALRSGKLAKEDFRVRDALTGREMTFDEAEKWGIITDNYYLDKKDNKRCSYAEAARNHYVYPTGGVPENAADAVRTTVKVQTRTEVSKKEAVVDGSIQQADYNIAKLVDLRHYDPSSGLFSHPDSDRQMTLKELIVKGFLDPYSTTVIDRRRAQSVKLLDAIRDNIVDDVTGTVKDTLSGREYDFASAIREGLIKDESVGESLEASFAGRLESGGVGGGHSPRLVERKLQLTPYAQEPSRPSTHRNGALMQHRVIGGQDGQKLVDLGGGHNVMVKVIKGEDGIEKGEYVDPTTGMKFTIQLHGDPYVTQTSTKVKSTSQVQTVELEPHAQFVGIDQVKDLRSGKVMTLQEAQRAGLARVDKKGKQNTKSYSAFRSNIELAVNKGIVDRHGQKISVEEAIRTGVLDIVELKYRHPQNNEPIDLSRAANMGLVDVTLAETLPNGVCNPASGEKISIKRAVEMGIVNPRSGEVRNPFNNERLTWVDLTKSVYASITMDGVYDPQKGYAVSVLHALNEGLIDPRTSQYHNSITGENMSLEEAVQKGIIDQETFRSITLPGIRDHRSGRQLTLLQAVDAKVIDPKNRTIQLSSDKSLPLGKAVEEGHISREIGDRLRRVDKVTFADALDKGLIDVGQDTFTEPDTGRQMTIAQAVSAGLIDTASVYAGQDIPNLSHVVSSDEFDAESGRVRDPKTGLNVTFREAVDRRLVDPDSLLYDIDSSRTATLQEAIRSGLISHNGKYINPKTHAEVSLKRAVENGLLALISSPMQAAQAVSEAVKRRDTEGLKFKLGTVDDGKRFSQPSQPTVREESVRVRLTPQRAEPGLSVRVRSNVSDDWRSSRGASVVDDPVALADLRQDLLEKLREQNIDLDERIVQNPSTMRDVSIREAVETGLLDATSGEIVHPESKRRYTLAKAAKNRLIHSDAAKRLAEALNISPDELGQFSPVSGTGSGRQSWTRDNRDSWHGASSSTDPNNYSKTTTYESPDGNVKRTSTHTFTRSTNYDQ